MAEREKLILAFRQTGNHSHVVDLRTGEVIAAVARNNSGTSLTIGADLAQRLNAEKPINQSLPDYIVEQARGKNNVAL